MRQCAWSFVVCLLFLWSTPSFASPWTLPRDELSLTLAYDFQFATQEYLGGGKKQAYPLNGTFSSSTVMFDLRYGFTPKFEGEVKLAFKQASFTSDPLLVRLPDNQGSLQDTRAAIQNFSDTAVGLSDIYFYGRYNLHRSWWLATVEVQAKIPPGYDQPTGLNVTLGDGQIDLQPSLLLGAFLPQTLTFGRADLGYNLRLGGPGHQLVGGLKVGQFVGKSFIFFAGLSFVQTLFEGDTFGDNFIVEDPSQTAVEIDAGTIRTVPLSLDRSFRRVEAGAIIRFQVLELQIGYSNIFSGDNIGALHSVNIASVVNIPNATAPAAPASEE